jgi:hypothetical protein
MVDGMPLLAAISPVVLVFSFFILQDVGVQLFPDQSEFYLFLLSGSVFHLVYLPCSYSAASSVLDVYDLLFSTYSF